MSATRNGWGHTVRCLTPPVLATTAFYVAGLLAVRELVPPAVLAETNDVLGNYLQTLGTIYAVLLAFVVVIVWGQFNDTRVQVEREANNLLDLHRTSRGLPTVEYRRLADEVSRYIDHVIDLEWPAMMRGDPRPVEAGWVVIENMSEAVRACQPHDDVQLAHVADLLARIDDLSDARSDRVATSGLNVPRAMRLLLHLGAFMTIGSLWLFSVTSLTIHIIMVAALAGAISHVLYLVRDLDNAFGGDFMVTPEPFERVRRHTRTHSTSTAP